MKQKATRIPIWQIWVVIAVLMLTALGCTLYLFMAEQKTDKLTVELGDDIPVDMHEYLIGLDWALSYSKLDISEVEEDEVGIYSATVKHGWQEFIYTIEIEDTTAPELVVKDKDFYLLKGEAFAVDEFVEHLDDASEDVEVSFSGDVGDAVYDDEVLYTECGPHTFTIEATDASGNKTAEKIKVVVDTSPVFAGIKEFYVAVGSTMDEATGVAASGDVPTYGALSASGEAIACTDVVACDDVDGDVTEHIEVDMTNVDTSTCGDYEINYSVEDSYGLRTEEVTTVHVMEPVEVQECLNKRLITADSANIIGALNLYDMGYFADDNVERTMDEVNPALVRIYFDKGDRGHSFGSGFIVEINDENVVICSNKHVVDDAKNWPMAVHFYNGISAPGRVVATQEANDISFSIVQISALDEAFVKTLKTVHINKGYWDDIPQNEDLSLCMSTVDRTGDIWVEYTGELLQKHANPPQELKRAKNWVVTEVSVKLINGVSGSPIVDGYGNFIAMARAISSGGNLRTQYWCVPLDQILDFYEETFGERLEYY